MASNRRNKAHIFTIALVAATGGLLFGFDTGVISGALSFIRDQWNLTDNQQGYIVSSVLMGAVIGSLFCGRIADRYSRRNTIIVTALMFSLGSVSSALSPNISWLVCSRIIIGIAIGISSFVVPLYISELSPARNRGALVTLNQLMITMGILLSYLSNLGLVDVRNNWRWMFLVGLIPSLMLFLGMLFLPKTPRWLMSKGFEAEAKKTLDRIEEQSLVDDALLKMKADMASDTEPHYKLKELFRPWHMTPFILGIGIMFIQQFIGINTFV
jgi:sugar porter (SP) family MFS transporter